MQKYLHILLRSKGAAELISTYGLGEAITDPVAVPGLTKLQRERLASIQAVTQQMTRRPDASPSISCSRDVFDKYKVKYGSRSGGLNREKTLFLKVSKRGH